jgi:RNA polymerase sigma factor (sigma-70 family)
MNSVLRHLSRAALGGLTDGQLLERFLGHRDEAAFEALVRRHGPMVLGVCRRVLRHEQDAEDAFQASFLVLARRAATVRAREVLGNWLYGVAYRTAMKARTMNARRRTREGRAGIKPMAAAATEDGWEELLPLLDEELSKLPDRYRVPVVLCHLEGKSRKEVARLLGLPEGTLSWRLAHARKVLAGRLARYGLAVSGGALAAALSGKTASAAVSRALAASTARAAVLVAAGGALTAGTVPAQVVILAEGVVKTMLLSKLRAVVAVGIVVFVSAGVVGLAYRTTAAEPGKPGAATPSVTGALAVADDLEALRLEVEALRKSLQATRERVKTLEGEVQALKSSPRAAGAAGELPAGASLLTPTAGKVSSVELAPTVGHSYSVEFVTPTTEKVQPVTTRPAGGADPLAEAEAALKKLREHPDDKQAADALEKAVQRLKEQSKIEYLQRLKEQSKIEYLEQQLERLKEQEKPEGQTGNPAIERLEQQLQRLKERPKPEGQPENPPKKP